MNLHNVSRANLSDLIDYLNHKYRGSFDFDAAPEGGVRYKATGAPANAGYTTLNQHYQTEYTKEAEVWAARGRTP